MIVTFPSALWCFEVDQPIAKGASTQIFHLLGVASLIVFMAPVDLKPMDRVLVDIRNGNVELIQRRFITIWHSAWRN